MAKHFMANYLMAKRSVAKDVRLVVVAIGLALVSSRVASQEHEFFHSSDQCIACHSGVASPEGQDISIGYTWRGSMMANSARDPYWQAGVRREVMDHPGARSAIEDTCATCHMPMARFHSANNGGTGEVFANLAPWDNHLAADGVSCTVCHQIRDDNLRRRIQLHRRLRHRYLPRTGRAPDFRSA